MRILTILGSPRKLGNTATVLAEFERAVGVEHQLQHVDLRSKDIGECVGCLACQWVPDTPGCMRKDDALDIFDAMIGADLVVYAAPVYSWSFPSRMKALIDRELCLAKYPEDRLLQSLVARKHAALLMTCGGAAGRNADLPEQAFRRQMDYQERTVMGVYVVDNCTTPRALGDRAKEMATLMAADVNMLARELGV